MTYTIRRAVALAVFMGLAWAIAIYEPHRVMLAWAWPYFTDFWFTYIAF